MKKLYVQDVLKKVKGEILCGNANEEIEEVSIDTRTIKKGDTYYGLRGENTDGSIYCKDAINKGAKICFIQENIFTKEELEKYSKTATVVLVENVEDTLLETARIKRSLYDIPVIGITGSVGKTSTKNVIAEVMAQKFNVQKTQGNHNNRIGVPLTIMGLKDHDALIVEMGMNHFGEISELTEVAKPTLCVISNIGTSHIGNLGSRENILKAKLEILEGLKENGTLVINNDNDLLNEWNKQNTKYNVIGVGIENKSDINAINIHEEEEKNTFTAIIGKEELNVTVPVIGNHFIYNAMCAIAVGKILEIEEEKILQGIQEFELTKDRMEIIKIKNNITIINDCYNANLDSMSAGIEALSKTKGNKKVAVLGDMLELGEYSEKLHKQVGAEVVRNNIDILITVGKEAKNIANIAKEKIEVYEFYENEEAIKKLKEILNNGDVVLVKASNGMHFAEIIETLKKE